MGFYWSYILLLEPPVLASSKVHYIAHIVTANNTFLCHNK